MPNTKGKSDAVILLPAADAAGTAWPGHARWQAAAGPDEPLRRILAALGQAVPPGGLAALRGWGQRGTPPTGWICGADPVHLEPRLDHLRLWRLADLPASAFAEIMARLQAELGAGGDEVFSAVDGCGYLERGLPLATAALSAETLHGLPPDPFLPAGSGAAAHDRLQSEIQMCLHDDAVNRERDADGLATVNALWFWGGGTVPAPVRRALPTLYGDDPLLRGYWFAAGAHTAPWPGSLEACADAGPGAFVAVLPDAADACLPGLWRLRRRFRRLVLLFPDGRLAEVRGAGRWRWWRRAAPAAAVPGR